MSRHETTTLFDAEKIFENFNQRKHIFPRSRDAPKRQRPSGSFDAWKAIDDMGNGVEYRAKEGESTAPVRDPAKIDLSPCHICHRKPSERRELDEYSHCECCGRRTCYVCIRQCEGLGMERERRMRYFGSENAERERMYGSQEIFGADSTCDLRLEWTGDEMRIERGRKDGWGSWESERGTEHKRKVCSRCCVERGPEGEVWCLGCLRTEEGD